MAVLSRFTDVSTPIQTESVRSVIMGVACGSTHASHHAMSMNVLSLVTKRFSIMRR
jgi:hypothetical protein